MIPVARQAGEILDSYCDVPVYENGYLFHRGHGRHYAADGYYYGQKWQCVEYVKRFYKQVLRHEMPDGMGHARSFFDDRIAHGALNIKRGLLQYYNSGDVKPRVNDILVFQDTQYGHMGIVTVVEEYIEIIQQNIFGKPRQRFRLDTQGHTWSICLPRLAAGWLRIPPG